jgi:L,D-transpeptidase ErfK/SrfK
VPHLCPADSVVSRCYTPRKSIVLDSLINSWPLPRWCTRAYPQLLSIFCPSNSPRPRSHTEDRYVRIVLISQVAISCVITTLLSIPAVCAEELILPTEPDDSLVGKIFHTYAREDETLLDVARKFDIGHDQIIAANPSINRWLPGTQNTIIIPSLYILPPYKPSEIVINLSELRLYFFPLRTKTVITFPVSIGDYDWKTPRGKTTIIKKATNPTWYPPQSIQKEHEHNGQLLPSAIPANDQRNPLGHFALYLGIPSYLIHGTDSRRSSGIGMHVSHGCIRMYPEDIEELFKRVRIGTRVSIIQQPIKVGRRASSIYLEYHRLQKDPLDTPLPLENDELANFQATLGSLKLDQSAIDPQKILQVYHRGDGIPTNISANRAVNSR